jgi:peptidoglycan hydrolase-like protein with peptidoglycan-binding domain
MAKEIQRSVGYGGANVMAQVMVVQYLLNCVPAARGGPTEELAVDGLIGPKTIAAIRRFQTTSFGRADGRVDPKGRTLQALQGYDPYPGQSAQAAGVFKMPMPPAPGSSSGAVFKSPGGPGVGGAPGGMPPGSPGQPFGKQPSSPPTPFGKQSGSGGSGGGKWGG